MHTHFNPCLVPTRKSQYEIYWNMMCSYKLLSSVMYIVVICDHCFFSISVILPIYL